MSKSTEETKLRGILDRLQGQRVTGQTRRLPGWAAAAILGAGLSCAACSPPTQEPCENCNNVNNVNNINNSNNPVYGINNINNTNNINNINNINNPLYGIPDAGTDDVDTGCANCEYGFPLYGSPEDAGTDAVPLYGKK